jgi:type IV secretory pathway VirB2 component (pilin)
MTKKMTVTTLLLGMLLMAGVAFSGVMPWDTGLTTLKDNLTGPVAGGVALMALMGAGAALVFSEDISGFIRKMLYLVLAVSVLVAASALLRVIQPSAQTSGLEFPMTQSE